MPQQSKKNLPSDVEKRLYQAFFQLIADIRNPKEAKEFCQSFFTETELSMLAKRLGIAFYLDKNKKYEDIQRTLNVSSATVAAVSDKIHTKGFQKALELIRTEDWASGWSQRILRSLGKRT